MKVFVTGASGLIGSEVAKAFSRAGHEVSGLVRSEEKAKQLRREEIKPVLGSIERPDSYASEAKEANVLVHCAFEVSTQGVFKDAHTIESFLVFAKEGRLPKTVIYTSGTWVYGSTGNKVVDEYAILNPIDLVKWRPPHEEKILKAASEFLKPIVIRPGIVYGSSGGITSSWFKFAETGTLEICGAGLNRLSMVHVKDLGMLYVKAAEKELGPCILNAVDGSRNTLKDYAEAIASNLKLAGPIKTLSKEESSAQFGALAQGLLIDQMVSADRALHLLNWMPQHRNFINNLPCLYEAWKASCC